MTKAMIIDAIVSMDESISKRELNRKRKDELLDIMLQMEQDRDSKDQEQVSHEETKVQEKASGWDMYLKNKTFLTLFYEEVKKGKFFTKGIGSDVPYLKEGHKTYTFKMFRNITRKTFMRYNATSVGDEGVKRFMNALYKRGYLKYFTYEVVTASYGTPDTYQLFYFSSNRTRQGESK